MIPPWTTSWTQTDCINNGYLVGHGHVDERHSTQTTRECGDTGLAVGMRQLLEIVQKAVAMVMTTLTTPITPTILTAPTTLTTTPTNRQHRQHR